jgi:hypothetical protein
MELLMSSPGFPHSTTPTVLGWPHLGTDEVTIQDGEVVSGTLHESLFSQVIARGSIPFAHLVLQGVPVDVAAWAVLTHKGQEGAA